MYYDKVLKIDPEDVDALTGKGVATSNLTPDFKPILYYGKNSDLEAYIYVTVPNKVLPRTANDTTPFDESSRTQPK